ncbi:MAG: hypothetical protein OXP66_09840, partial [Candidatus Tectomicrobia bacterium]|nr:hypothetical protein [Candidatus Tectomicrobia bacterium]
MQTRIEALTEAVLALGGLLRSWRRRGVKPGSFRAAPLGLRQRFAAADERGVALVLTLFIVALVSV